jgi:hypothetical protein
MPIEYKPSGKYDPPFDSGRCRASVYHTIGNWGKFNQCLRKSKVDGWCNYHHPDTETGRRKASELKYKRDLAASEIREVSRSVNNLEGIVPIDLMDKIRKAVEEWKTGKE